MEEDSIAVLDEPAEAASLGLDGLDLRVEAHGCLIKVDSDFRMLLRFRKQC